MLSEVFYTFVISSSIGLIVLISKLIFKSKCKNVDCCCIHIIRDTENETKERELEIIHHTNSNNNDDKL
jgi:hypothetical protein